MEYHQNTGFPEQLTSESHMTRKQGKWLKVWFYEHRKLIFNNSAPLGRVGHRVAMSGYLRHRVQFFSRPLIGPQVT